MMVSVGMAILATAFGMPAMTSGPSPAQTNARAVGQMIIAGYEGPTPPQALLTAIRQGQVGSVILMGDNTAGSVTVTEAAATKMQAAARAGGNPGLLIMTDQEGGEVERLPGPPAYPADKMSNPMVARLQGLETGEMLKGAGVNVDLAPVSDVSAVDGFMTQEQRTFGSNATTVADAACAFAAGLKSGGVAYTLKHFPGLGDAINSTDVQPVAINQSSSTIYKDDAAYRRCGHGPTSLVMVSSASYSHLTGSLPAVMSPTIYNTVIPADGIDAVTVSDAIDSGALNAWSHPARRAAAAGVDMLMYPGSTSKAIGTYRALLTDVNSGSLGASRVQQAARAVLALKQNLGLSPLKPTLLSSVGGRS